MIIDLREKYGDDKKSLAENQSRQGLLFLNDVIIPERFENRLFLIGFQLGDTHVIPRLLKAIDMALCFYM